MIIVDKDANITHGSVEYSNDNDYNSGSRPIICLKSSAKLEKREDGNYNLVP